MSESSIGDAEAVENASNERAVVLSGLLANWRSVVIGLISVGLGLYVGTLSPKLNGTSGFYRLLFVSMGAITFLYAARNIRTRLKQYRIAERVAADNA